MAIKGMATNKRANWHYYDYIDANPLYIHNHKRYFENTLKQINKIDDPIKTAKNLGLEYVDYLKKREQQLLENLSTNRSGEENLKIIIHDVFIGGDTNRIETLYNLLNDVFYMNKDIKISVGRGSKKDNTKNNTYLRISRTDPETLKRKIERIRLFLNEDKKNGNSKYDYVKSAEAFKNSKNFDLIKELLDEICDSINDAIVSEDNLRLQLSELVSKPELDKSLASGGTLRKYLDNKNNSKASIDELLEFLVDKLGQYSDIRGIFSEASKFEYTEGIREIFGDTFTRDIGDQQKRKGTVYKKPDIIINGKTIHGQITPITISRKFSLSDSIKFHEGSINSVSDMLFQIDDRLARDYLYLNTNLGYYSDVQDAQDIIRYIYKFMSYLFISSANAINESEKAMYLLITTTINGKVQTSFVPISSILLAIINGDETVDIKMSPALEHGSKGLGKLWELKLNTTKVKGKRSKKRLLYRILSVDDEVVNQSNTMVQNLLKRNRRFTVFHNENDLERVISSGIITGG